MVSVKDRKTPRPMTGRRPWEPDYPCCSASSLVVVNPQILGSKGISSQFQMKMQGYFRTELLSIIPDQQTWISKTDYPAILKKIKRKKKKTHPGCWWKLFPFSGTIRATTLTSMLLHPPQNARGNARCGPTEEPKPI